MIRYLIALVVLSMWIPNATACDRASRPVGRVVKTPLRLATAPFRLVKRSALFGGVVVARSTDVIRTRSTTTVKETYRYSETIPQPMPVPCPDGKCPAPKKK